MPIHLIPGDVCVGVVLFGAFVCGSMGFVGVFCLFSFKERVVSLGMFKIPSAER